MNKPRCELLKTDGNVFSLLAVVLKCLRRAGQQEQAEEVKRRITECKSYDEALRLFMEYVDID